MSDSLSVYAGKAILEMIRDEGLRAGRVNAYVGPASGPRCTVIAGIDLALAASGFLEGHRRVLMVGASAGAWRMVCLAQRDPVAALQRFRDAYVNMTFTAQQSLRQRSTLVWKAAASLVPREEISPLLDHPHYDLCVDTVRVVPPLSSSNRLFAVAGYAAALAANEVHPRFRSLFMRPVRFCAGKGPFPPLLSGGEVVPLREENLYPALAASGSVPVALLGVKDIPLAPPGTYVDGGLEQYIINGRYSTEKKDVTLLAYHGAPLVPTWLDKKAWRPYRRLPSLDNLLAVCPSRRFVADLPHRRVPDRQDWTRFAKDPAGRIRFWNNVIDRSLKLGDLFMELTQGGPIRNSVLPITRLLRP